jgi:hypothetical protein
MATRKGPTKKSSTKKSAKKSSKKSAKKSTKQSSKKSSKRLAATTDISIVPPNLGCINACATAYSRCLAGGGNPKRCMKVFVSCLQGCFRRGGVGGVGGVGGGDDILIPGE